MKFNKTYLIIVLFALPRLLNAQNYKPGYIINLKGDTTRGYIELKEWGKNPESINFKQSDQNSPTQKLTVNEISYFEIINFKAYRAFNASISLGETNIQKLQGYRDTSTKTELVFLKVLQSGKKVTLYSFVDDEKERFYIFDSIQKKLDELVYRIYFVDNDKNNVSTKSQEGYKQQLLLIAQQYPTFNESITHVLLEANYTSNDLISICRKINNSVASKLNKDKDTEFKYFTFFAGAGVAFNTINLGGTFPLYNPTRSTSSVSPVISAGINFYPVPDVGSSVIKLELSYFKTKDKNIGELYAYPPVYYGTYSFEQSNYSLILQFQYNVYNTDPLKLYLDAGVSTNFSTYTGNNVYNSYTNENQTNYTGLVNLWFSIPLKAGIILNKHFDCSVTYYIPVSIADQAGGTHESFDNDFKLNTIKVGFAYNF